MSYVDLLNDSFDGLLETWLERLQAENSDLPKYLIDRHRHMAKYNCVGGKYFRGTQVINFAAHACEATGKDFESIKANAVALGWAIEVLQSCFLVADDLMDGSTTRRGRPCWYLCEDVKMDAVNDALILESFMHHLIEIGTKGDDCYHQVLRIYLDTCQRTQLGQTLDLLSMPQGRKSVELLRTFDLALYKRIVKYKTAFYTFSLPMCAGMAIGGLRDPALLKCLEAISIEIGEKFQIQDDYLDCFQDPTILGKIGTDIQDHKCSWLCVQALAIMNDEQRLRYEANYGHHEPEKVQIIKDLYVELNLTSIYEKQEVDSLARIHALIEENKSLVQPKWFEQVIKMVHGRQK